MEMMKMISTTAVLVSSTMPGGSVSVKPNISFETSSPVARAQRTSLSGALTVRGMRCDLWCACACTVHGMRMHTAVAAL